MTKVAALALLGDWNVPAHATGRWTTSWLADRAGLRVQSAGPGRHGDIDYIVSDAHASGAGRHDPPGPAGSQSDHDVVTITLHDPDNEAPPLRLATWNMERDRSRALVRGQLRQVLAVHQPDVLALQEAKQYHEAIRTVARASGYKVLASEVPGQWHNVLMVREELPTAGPLFVQLAPRGWETVAGPEHTPPTATSWRVSWLRVVCVHMPPSVRWVKGLPVGPPLRVAALVASMRKLRRWAVRARRRRS